MIALTILLLLIGGLIAIKSVSYASPLPMASQTPVSKIQGKSYSSLDSYIYPNSNMIAISTNEVVLISYDSPDSISGWYSQKIDSENFSSKNVIKTNSNGFISDKISGQKDNAYVNVDIQKTPKENTSKITISIS